MTPLFFDAEGQQWPILLVNHHLGPKWHCGHHGNPSKQIDLERDLKTIMLATLNMMLTLIEKETKSPQAIFTRPTLPFVTVASIIPVAIGPDATLLKQIAPGVIWLQRYFAILISIGTYFANDAQDLPFGFLLLLSPYPQRFYW